MERHGFIHDMLDVKVLILYVMNRVLYPVDGQKVYELCYQDETLSYFDVQEALPQMVRTGHLEQTPEGYVITDKGREACEVTEDSLAYPLAQRVGRAVESFNREVRRSSFIHTEILGHDNGEYSAVMGLSDEKGVLMTLEMTAPTQRQALRLTREFQRSADVIFQMLMTQLTDEADED